MYGVEEETAWVRDLTTGERFMQDPSDPRFQAYLEWVSAGGEPSVIRLGGMPQDFALQELVDPFTRNAMPPSSWNWKTSTTSPLRKVVQRDSGWVVRELYMGTLPGQTEEIPCVEMTFSRTFGPSGLVATIQKRMYYHTILGEKVLVKLFPEEDVSADAVRLGTERRQALVDDLTTEVVTLIVHLFSSMTPGEMISLGLTVPPVSQAAFVAESVEIGREFVASLGQDIASYVAFHTLSRVRASIEAHTAWWLDVDVQGLGVTLRQVMIQRLT
jgi:hypothetical protein